MSRQPQANSRSQPTPRVGNLSGSRREAVSDGSSHLHHAPPNATGALERPAKRAWRRTIQSMIYADIETEHDAQAPTETVRLSDESSDEYQNSRRSDQTESDTEPDAEDNDIPEATGAGLGHRSQTADG
ncbi:hypothetical protein B9Z19DRAFT_1065364 [Tuber borchii]|uniref:Uncharacterized protein n=1 Tax=Tuber borchii TaxID=42251 RepID=A0A2T6ZRI7_TUBBO|nr:hypothetical protein B9Z19DRAFT_1065364 [Tuber borchii]